MLQVQPVAEVLVFNIHIRIVPENLLGVLQTPLLPVSFEAETRSDELLDNFMSIV